jgi:hypothetical protein
MRFGERGAWLRFLLVWDAEFVYLAFFFSRYGQPGDFEGLASPAAKESQHVPQEFQSHQNQLPQLVKLLPASKEHRRVWHFFLICGFAASRGV